MPLRLTAHVTWACDKHGWRGIHAQPCERWRGIVHMAAHNPMCTRQCSKRCAVECRRCELAQFPAAIRHDAQPACRLHPERRCALGRTLVCVAAVPLPAIWRQRNILAPVLAVTAKRGRAQPVVQLHSAGADAAASVLVSAAHPLFIERTQR